MIDGRKRIASVLATLCIAALSGSVLTATPTYAEPSIDDVQSTVDRLYHEAEQASERYNGANEELKDAQSRLETLKSDQARQDKKVEEIREQVAAAVVSQYQGQALSSTTQVMLSEDPDAFLNQVATVSEYNDQQGQLMANFAIETKRLEMREQAAERELAEIRKTEEQLAAEKAQIDKLSTEAEELLSRLEDEEAARALRASRESSRAAAAAAAAPAAAPAAPAAAAAPAAPAPAATAAAPTASVSGRAGAAVSYALAQVGDAYVYGAAGPSAFDCSGLTMMAWAQAGVGLPHSSSAQMSAGASVSQSDLQPGDLVFYYSPVSHVGIYIGNGQIAHAANPGSGVAVAPVFSMPYSGAVRPG